MLTVSCKKTALLTIVQQPTEFWLNVYNISEVFDTPHLVQSLANYSERLEQDSKGIFTAERNSLVESESILFLHVQAAADYFTTNQTLMLQPSPVDIDLILDPYIGGIFPRSLGPISIYIATIASVAWLTSKFSWKYLAAGTPKAHTE